jgi:uncharacterized protein (TIRG00374 family)
MAKTQHAVLPKRTKGRLLLLALFLLLLYLVVPQIDDFSTSISSLRDARPELVAAAILLLVVTYGFAAGVYQSLALRLKGVEYRHTLLVQFATAFTNRLLPAGLGGMSLNVQYLRKHGHTVPEAIAIAGLNNTMGAVGHALLLLVVVLVARDEVITRLDAPHISVVWLLVATACLLLAAVFLLARRLRRTVSRSVRQIVVYLAAYRRHPEKLFAALLCSLALTVCYVLVFYLSVYSLGIDLPLVTIFAVFTAGVVAGAVTPTPGGLVGVEAGLVAGLVAYDVDAATALAGVLLFRFITYWLPLFAGFVVFTAIRKKYL